MKLVFVVGGSYKSFYFNELNKISKADLVVFHQDIFYDFNYEKEKVDGTVSKELINLNKKLKCPIVVYGILNNSGVRNKCYILCVNKKVNVIDCNKDLYLYIKGKLILIGNRIYKYSRAFATISFIKEQYVYDDYVKTSVQNYFLCDKRGVSYIKSGKFDRKFRKCCYFTLNFNKKML